MDASTTTRTAPEPRSAPRGWARAGLPLGIALLLAGAAAARAEGPAPTPTPTPKPAPIEQAIPHAAATEIVVTAPRMDIPL
ncbi:MAG TPA: hypothetical protein PK435_06050, partial [Thermoanaerobaculaceae bacterium]|nr:hypothetical protein [Thermoanaerobaculaceae bacterium]